MKSSSDTSAVERAQPWLGTLVSIRVEGITPSHAHTAIDAAFAEVATVHRLMSFHEKGSDVSRLNRLAAIQPVPVHPYTFTVLRHALDFSARSGGRFDISVAGQLVEWGFLPRVGVDSYAAQGSWRDIELQSDGSVVFQHPLLIDLGGIAKGFAVDRAMDVLRSRDVQQCLVNAGGDISVKGQQAEKIILDRGFLSNELPVVEVHNGSVASSTAQRQAKWYKGQKLGPHVDGVSRSPVATDRFASVVAERCVVADALTKVVLAQGTNSRQLLQQFGASAHVYDTRGGWEHIE